MKREIVVCGIILMFVGLAIMPSINAVNNDPIADIDCSGEIDFVDAIPGATITGSITIENIGEPGSLLNWEIESWPEWTEWTFDPENGIDLLPGDSCTITVEVVVPIEPDMYTGEILIVNVDNPDDFCIIDVYYDGESVSVFKCIKQLWTSTFSSYYNIGNTIFDPVADLDCYGEIDWMWPPIGETVTGTITVENTGEPGSLLNWEILSWPSFGVWSFHPDSGTGLLPGDSMDICVEVLATGGEMFGEVVIVNSDNPDDFCEIYISISGFPPPPRKIIGFIDSLNISEYFISFHIKLALGIFESYGFPPWPIVRIQFNKDFFNSKYYEGDIDDNFVNAIFYY